MRCQTCSRSRMSCRCWGVMRSQFWERWRIWACCCGGRLWKRSSFWKKRSRSCGDIWRRRSTMGCWLFGGTLLRKSRAEFSPGTGRRSFSLCVARRSFSPGLACRSTSLGVARRSPGGRDCGGRFSRTAGGRVSDRARFSGGRLTLSWSMASCLVPPTVTPQTRRTCKRQSRLPGLSWLEYSAATLFDRRC